MGMLDVIKELKEMRKEKGLGFCEDCLRKKCNEANPRVDAFKASIESGLYRKIEGKKCYLCGADAKYQVNLRDAMRGIKHHLRRR
jgi:hypothetical protein